MSRLRIVLGALLLIASACSSSREYWKNEEPANMYDNWAQSRPENNPAPKK
jgi:hypothetical protein